MSRCVRVLLARRGVKSAPASHRRVWRHAAKVSFSSGQTASRSRECLQVQVLSDPSPDLTAWGPGLRAVISSVPGGQGAGGDLGTEGWGLVCPLSLSFDLPASGGVSGHLGFQMSFFMTFQLSFPLVS